MDINAHSIWGFNNPSALFRQYAELLCSIDVLQKILTIKLNTSNDYNIRIDITVTILFPP